MRHFPAAPWPTALKLTSGTGTLLLLLAWYATAKGVPPSGVTHGLGSIVIWLPPVLLFVALLFVVRGYDVDARGLHVRRLLWSTRIPLTGLTRVWHDPHAISGSTRVFGNGGMFAFTGWYGSDTLGRFQMFATDPTRAVVLQLPERTIIVSPAAPRAFVHHLREAFQATR